MTRRLMGWVCGVTLLLLLSAAILPQQALSQDSDKKIELAATYSYMWAGSYSLYEGEIVMDDGSSWGGALDYAFRPDAKIELSYSYTSSHAKFSPYYYGGTSTALENLDNPVSIQYFQLGSIYQLPKGKAQPFFGLLLGAVLFHPSGTAQGLELSDKWNFAVSLVGGVKIYLNEQVGVRLQGRLLLPMYFSGGSMYVGTGGAGVAVGAGIPVVQGDVGIGVFVCL
jgi:hypothetical protein